MMYLLFFLAGVNLCATFLNFMVLYRVLKRGEELLPTVTHGEPDEAAEEKLRAEARKNKQWEALMNYTGHVGEVDDDA